jgi:DNA-binding transcriptional MocR family regulator
VPLLAEVASHWIQTGAADLLIAARRTELAARNRIARSVLGPQRIRSHTLGHHVWMELSPPWRSETFVSQALKTGVAVQGRAWFVIEPVMGAMGADGVRIALGNAPDRDLLRSSLRRLASLAASEPVPAGRDSS